MEKPRQTAPVKQKAVKRNAEREAINKKNSKSTAGLAAASVHEIFARLAASMPSPRTELDYVNPFTLLIAVVLSAQATDIGVNKATRSLFAKASTPAQMLALGEEKVREAIKTIGLFNTKA